MTPPSNENKIRVTSTITVYFKGFFKLTFASSSSLSPARQSSHPTICVSHSVLLIPLCPAGSPHRYSPVNHPEWTGRSKETTHAKPARQNNHHRRSDRLKFRSGDLPRDARRRHHGRKLHVQHMGRLPDQHAGDCTVEDLVSRACQPHPSGVWHRRYPPGKDRGQDGGHTRLAERSRFRRSPTLHRGRLRAGSAHSPDDLQHGDLGRQRMLRE